jgi:hypothetical protein
MVASNGAHRIAELAELKRLNDRYRSLPSDATDADRHDIVDEMIDLIKHDPSLISALATTHGIYDPPNLGDVGPYEAQTRRWAPKSGDPKFAPLWELESEHVVPQEYLSKLFTAIDAQLRPQGLPMPRITGDEYGAMTTVHIYRGAASLKTRTATTGDLAIIRSLADQFGREVDGLRQARAISDSPAEEREAFLAKAEDLVSRLDRAFDEGRAPGGVYQRTVEAIRAEWSQNAVARGWPTLSESEARRDQVIDAVGQAHSAQVAQLRALYEARLIAAITSPAARWRGR